MGISKGLLLGSAAAAVAMTAGTAFAADLPSRKAAPVAYVKICDVYGRGFYYIPGSNTCLRVGGRVRVEYGYRRAQNTYKLPATGGSGTTSSARLFDTLGWKARAYVNMDARTQTAWGTVQTVFSLAVRSRSGLFNGGNNSKAGGNTTASVQLYAAYIRFAGFTFGRAPHTFSSGPGFLFYHTNYSGGGAIGALQLTYTAVFGGGFSATISLQDKNDFGQQRATFIGGTGAIAPNRVPNLVLTLRVGQGWGHFRVAGAIGQNKNTNNGATGTTRDKGGWAVGADARINLMGRGTALWVSAAYADGLLDYATGGNQANGSFAKDGRVTGGFLPSNANVIASAGCATAGGVCVMQTWKAWRAMIALSHRWTSTLRSNFALSYMSQTAPSNARLLGVPNSQSWQASANIVWSPAKRFDIGLEVYYASIRHSLPSNAAGTAIRNILLANGVRRNPTDFGVKVRVQRTF